MNRKHLPGDTLSMPVQCWRQVYSCLAAHLAKKAIVCASVGLAEA